MEIRTDSIYRRGTRHEDYAIAESQSLMTFQHRGHVISLHDHGALYVTVYGVAIVAKQISANPMAHVAKAQRSIDEAFTSGHDLHSEIPRHKKAALYSWLGDKPPND